MKRSLFALCFLTSACAVLYAGAGGVGDGPAAVPEPGSVVLLGTAAIGIGYATWRRSRKK